MCQIFLIKMSLNVKSQGTKVIEFSSQGTNDSKNMRRGPLYVADYEYVNISSLTVLDIKLWLEKNGGLHTDQPLNSFKFIQSWGSKLIQNVVILLP